MDKEQKKQVIYESPSLVFINVTSRRRCIAVSTTDTPGGDGTGWSDPTEG